MNRDISIIKNIISKATICIEDNQGSLIYEDENFLLEAYSNFSNGETSIDFWIDDKQEYLSSQEKDLVWDEIEKERQIEKEKQLDSDEYEETLYSLPRV